MRISACDGKALRFNINVEEGSLLSNLTVSVEDGTDYVYLITEDSEYDFYSIEDGVARLTLKNEALPTSSWSIICVNTSNRTQTIYTSSQDYR